MPPTVGSHRTLMAITRLQRAAAEYAVLKAKGRKEGAIKILKKLEPRTTVSHIDPWLSRVHSGRASKFAPSSHAFLKHHTPKLSDAVARSAAKIFLSGYRLEGIQRQFASVSEVRKCFWLGSI